jgi:hypothetical protein
MRQAGEDCVLHCKTQKPFESYRAALREGLLVLLLVGGLLVVPCNPGAPFHDHHAMMAVHGMSPTQHNGMMSLCLRALRQVTHLLDLC